MSITRGRTHGELCYAINSQAASGVFAQVPGSGKEAQLFHSVDTHLSELDFSFADGALACTVAGARGTSAIGVLADDGKGLRTVTEGDVIDRAPRWAPGGRAEIVYASAGIGRAKTGKAVGRSPFALHRLRFSDNSVEVLMADAQYDYATVVPVSESLLYALRRSYDRAPPVSAFGRVSSAFRSLFSAEASAQPKVLHNHELVRITPKGSQLVHGTYFPSTSQPTKTSCTRTVRAYSEWLHIRRRPSRSLVWSASSSWSFTSDLPHCAGSAGRSTVLTVRERSSGLLDALSCAQRLRSSDRKIESRPRS
ncbi:MAG: hypothetical protein WDO74_10455 [Pseudomonadota bacterium]